MTLIEALNSYATPRSMDVHDRAQNIRNMVNRAEGCINHQLNMLEGQKGFSSETLPVIRMEADAKTLRALADRLDEMRAQLTRT